MSKVRQIFLDQDGVLADFADGLTTAMGYKVSLEDEHDVYDTEKRKLTLLNKEEKIYFQQA